MGKKYRTERRRIDARRVHVVIHNQDAVEYYKKHPERDLREASGPATGDGPPSAEAAAESWSPGWGITGSPLLPPRGARSMSTTRSKWVQGRPGLGRVLGMAVQLGMAAQLLSVQERWEEEP
jgi:hypothetical protein